MHPSVRTCRGSFHYSRLLLACSCIKFVWFFSKPTFSLRCTQPTPCSTCYILKGAFTSPVNFNCYRCLIFIPSAQKGFKFMVMQFIQHQSNFSICRRRWRIVFVPATRLKLCDFPYTSHPLHLYTRTTYTLGCPVKHLCQF